MQRKSPWLHFLVAASLSTAGIHLPAGQTLAAGRHHVSCTAWHPTDLTETEQLRRPYAVMVPEQRTKTITTTLPRLVSEVRRVEKRVKVPVIKTIEKPYTVIVPVRTEKTVTRTVQVPWIEEIQETYQVRVPAIEEGTRLRTVIKRVPVQTTKAVTYQSGHWETETKQVAIRPVAATSSDLAASQPRSRQTVQYRKWVPTTETREVPVTMWRCEQEEVPFTFRRKIYRQEERTRTRHVRRWREEKRTHTVWVTKRVPETRTRNVQLKSWKWETRSEQVVINRRVPETHTEEVCYTVMVPKVKPCQVITASGTRPADAPEAASTTLSQKPLDQAPAVVPCGLVRPTSKTACQPQARPRRRFICGRHQFLRWHWRRSGR